MTRYLRLAAVLGLAAMLAGCALPPTAPVMPPYGGALPVMPPYGGAFNNTGAPLNLKLHGTELGTRQGRATAACVLGLISFGDASIAEAARQGGIREVTHADAEFTNLLGLYTTYTTVVYGN